MIYKIIALSSLLVLSFLSGCAEQSEQEEANLKSFNDEQLAYAKSINKIIAKITQRDYEEKNYFDTDLGNKRNSQVVFLGERHDADDCVFKNVQYLHENYRDNAVILLEGGTPFKPGNCNMLILHIYAAKSWAKTGEKNYDPYEFAKYFVEVNKHFSAVEGSINMAKLAWSKGVCVHWDDQGKSTQERNKSLATVVKKYAKEGRLVFVKTGLMHITRDNEFTNNILKKDGIEPGKAKMWLRQWEKENAPIYKLLEKKNYSYVLVVPNVSPYFSKANALWHAPDLYRFHRGE